MFVRISYLLYLGTKYRWIYRHPITTSESAWICWGRLFLLTSSFTTLYRQQAFAYDNVKRKRVCPQRYLAIRGAQHTSCADLVKVHLLLPFRPLWVTVKVYSIRDALLLMACAGVLIVTIADYNRSRLLNANSFCVCTLSKEVLLKLLSASRDRTKAPLRPTRCYF